MRGSRGWLAAAVAILSGCSGGLSGPAAVQLTPGFSAPGTPYRSVLERYTRQVELYQGLDTVAKGWATWRAPALRRAEAEASILAYGLQGEAAESLRKEAERAGRGVREFHVALYTPDESWNDLESTDTLWQPYVELPGGERLEPTLVQHVSKSGKSGVEYPYVTHWTREYALSFPLLTGEERQEHLDLVLAGPLGTMRFRF